MPNRSGKRILAVASGGGHWEELMLLCPAWQGEDVHYATTLKGLAKRAELHNAHYIPDCNRDEKLNIVRSATAITALLLRIRPKVIVTTGALPGLIAVMIGKRLGARTAWIDSFANVEEMSLAGQRAHRHADLWISQWPSVAELVGAEHAGSLL